MKCVLLQRKLLDISLGFAAGVMIAASYWSLLAPAIEMATKSKIYGAEGEYAFVPIGVGFLIGAAFVYGTDALISSLGIQSPNVLLAMQSVGTKQRRKILAKLKSDEDLDDYDPYNDVQISGGKMYTQIESTTIDGIIFFSCNILSVGLENGISSRYMCILCLCVKLSMYTRPSLLPLTINNQVVQKRAVSRSTAIILVSSPQETYNKYVLPYCISHGNKKLLLVSEQGILFRHTCRV